MGAVIAFALRRRVLMVLMLLFMALPALNLINPFPWAAPLEEVRLKKK